MTHSPTSKFFIWLFLIGWAIFIFYSSTVYPHSEFKRIIFLDKIIHLFQYGLFAWLFFKAIKISLVDLSSNRTFLLVLLIGFFYGVGIECYQHFLPYRSFSVLDIGANLLGLMVGSQIASNKIKRLIRK